MTELLVTVTIIGLLTAIAIASYNNFSKSSSKTWAKAEMAEIAKLMQMAKSSDGYYHQFIYAMGYRPEETVYASVGTNASKSTICCNKYPNPGTTPCSKNRRSGFLYYNCGNSQLDVATDNLDICDNASYDKNCNKKSGLTHLQTSQFTCPIISQWCNCNSFNVGAITNFKTELTLTVNGTLCEN